MRPGPLKNFLLRVLDLGAAFGVNGIRTVRAVRGVPSFVGDLVRYRSSDFPFRWRNLFPTLDEKGETAGSTSGHYFHQDLWAAREIFKRNPRRHVDIGSRIDGFVAHLLSFREVDVIDIRPLPDVIEGLHFIRSDATELREIADNSIESLSTLHAAEHFGLGRYGDPIDPDAWKRFVHALERVLAPGGNLYFSVPCGRQRVEFNAHRIFHPSTIIKEFAGLELVELHGVLDDGNFYRDVDLETLARQRYGCGLFHFTKSS